MIKPEDLLREMDAYDLPVMGYTRGLVRYGTIDIDGLLKVLPNTVIDILSPQTHEEEREIAHKWLPRARVAKSLSASAFPKYTTEFSPNRDFYDYTILGDIRKPEKAHTWSRLKMRGISINIPLHSGSEYGILEKRKSIVIMGTNRGATYYTYMVLRELGRQIPLIVAHQGFGRDGIVAGGVTGAIFVPGSVALHQVREPISMIWLVSELIVVVANMVSFPARFIGYHWKKGDDPILWAMRYWYYWNQIAERKAIWTYRIEELRQRWGKFCILMDIPELPFPDVPTDMNTRRGKKGAKYPHVDWDVLRAKDTDLADKIYRLAGDYGYEY